jgi:hypothetical protein
MTAAASVPLGDRELTQSTIRIWHQSMTELEENPAYGETLEEHAAAVVDPTTEVVMHGLRPGTHQGVPPGQTLFRPYADHVLLRQVVEHARTAEAEGYDAGVIGSYSEPFLREARAAVEIPIVSMAESTPAHRLFHGHVLGARVDEPSHRLDDLSDRRGTPLSERVAKVTNIEPGLDEV